jgi:hypothetical protein
MKFICTKSLAVEGGAASDSSSNLAPYNSFYLDAYTVIEHVNTFTPHNEIKECLVFRMIPSPKHHTYWKYFYTTKEILRRALENKHLIRFK